MTRAGRLPEGLVHELLEARDEKRLCGSSAEIAGYRLLIIDELSYVRSRRPEPNCCSRFSATATSAAAPWSASNLPFDEWTSVFGSERLTGALLDRLTHHVHILEMNGGSFRLIHSDAVAPARADPSSTMSQE